MRSESSACRNLALDLVLQISASRKQTELSARVRDNVSNALLASVKLPGELCSCMPRAAEFGAPGSVHANIRMCSIAECVKLDTCMLDVKDGYCGICYQFFPPAVAKEVSEEYTQFCEQLGTHQLYVAYLFGLRSHRPQQLLLGCK